MWWIAPVAAGAGVFAMLGLRHQRAQDARRLEFDAAKLELHDARVRSWGARNAVKLARAEVTHLQAERAASRATPADVAAARRRVQAAQIDARAAAAAVHLSRMRVSAARSRLPETADPAHRPLAALMAAHDAVTARWLAYETDPSRLITFPVMSDARVPTTAAFLTARTEAQRLRPTTSAARITPVEYVAYRNAVDRVVAAFDAAEQAAWSEARASGMVPPAPAPQAPAAWSDAAARFFARSAEALAWATDTAATLADAQRVSARTPEPSPAPQKAAAPSQGAWPVPSRTSQRPAS